MKSSFTRPVLAVLVGLMLSGCATRYEYACFRFADGLSARPRYTGAADPKVCKAAFHPGVYLGPFISIPRTATVFGVLVFRGEGESRAIPLFTWQSADKSVQYGCNGPSPAFAHKATNDVELMEQLIARISK